MANPPGCLYRVLVDRVVRGSKRGWGVGGKTSLVAYRIGNFSHRVRRAPLDRTADVFILQLAHQQQAKRRHIRQIGFGRIVQTRSFPWQFAPCGIGVHEQSLPHSLQNLIGGKFSQRLETFRKRMPQLVGSAISRNRRMLGNLQSARERE